jgi:hypothetical protein
VGGAGLGSPQPVQSVADHRVQPDHDGADWADRTGNIGATDPEDDTLTYTVAQQPQNGKVTIDQATGAFTYTPNDINYDAAQTDSFTVLVTDGNKFNLLGLFKPRSAQTTVEVTVLNPTVSRVILNLPDSITSPANPRYAEDGKSIYFAAQPTAGGRTEIYQIDVDGTNVECVTCGVSTSETGSLAKPVPFTDGSGRVLVLVNVQGQTPAMTFWMTVSTGDSWFPSPRRRAGDSPSTRNAR